VLVLVDVSVVLEVVVLPACASADARCGRAPNEAVPKTASESVVPRRANLYECFLKVNPYF
jgi:hypothetical protein